jgi:predicted RNA-binding protein with PUA-like domain
MPSYWLVKSEPSTYSWQDLVRDGKTVWDGVRSFEARNNLRAMKKGDLLLFYHSNVDKAVVGVAKVVRAAYPDPSAEGEDWSCVDVAPVQAFAERVTLERMKADAKLSSFALLRRARLSVVPASAAEYERVLELGKTKLRSS